MSFIELTSPQGKPLLVLHSSIECIYDQNDEHMHKLLTEIRLSSGISQFVRELPQYIKQEVLTAAGILNAGHSEKRFYSPPEHIPIPILKPSLPPPHKRTPPRKKS